MSIKKTRKIKVKTIKRLVNIIKKELTENKETFLDYKLINNRYYEFYVFNYQDAMNGLNPIVQIDLISTTYYTMSHILNEIFKKHIQFSK